METQMELKTFIKTALTDIIGAITEAQSEIDNGYIVPTVKNNYASIEHGISHLQTVDFEVCVTAEESKGSEGKLGVVSSIIGAGISGKSSVESSNVSKLKFSIPVALPIHEKQKKQS